MTTQEIEKKIDEIKTAEFFLQMKDRWNRADFDLSYKHDREIRELEKMLEEVE